MYDNAVTKLRALSGKQEAQKMLTFCSTSTTIYRAVHTCTYKKTKINRSILE